MLYNLFTADDKVKFSEYIPHLLVRASSQSKARVFANKAYPRHPLPLTMPEWVRCAPLGTLSTMVFHGPDAPAPLYFLTWPEVSETEIREVLRTTAWEATPYGPLVIDRELSSIHPVEGSGKAGVIARTEHMTRAIQKHPQKCPLFLWRKVSDQWPNPSQDPNVMKSDFMQPHVVQNASALTYRENFGTEAQAPNIFTSSHG